jgi:hypothetical protein
VSACLFDVAQPTQVNDSGEVDQVSRQAVLNLVTTAATDKETSLGTFAVPMQKRVMARPTAAKARVAVTPAKPKFLHVMIFVSKNTHRPISYEPKKKPPKTGGALYASMVYAIAD